jgi:hypothetical protein
LIFQYKFAKIQPYMKKLFMATLITLHTFSVPSSVFAVTTPSFPACANPQGTTKASYSEGAHGIVGSGTTYTGRDEVYTLTDDTLTQCFCPADGFGIQTNWWKASSLSENDINVLKSEGWIYIPTGALWGLSDAPYVAKNSNYSCLPGGTGGGSSEVLGEGTGGGEVLGLAATGDRVLVYTSFAIGALLLAIGLRRIRQNS